MARDGRAHPPKLSRPGFHSHVGAHAFVCRQSHGHPLDGHRLRTGAGQADGFLATGFPGLEARLFARDNRSGKNAALIGTVFKIAVPVNGNLPGLLARAVLPMHLFPASGLEAGQHSYNEVLPLMLARYCGPGLLGLGITALVAGFMAGMAGNVSAFATVWTYDIYRPFIRKAAP